MLKIIVATETDGLNERHLVMVLDVDKEDLDVEQAVLNACKEYCLTEEGKKVFDYNCNCFNWGDFDIYVPNEICEKYGFKKVESTVAKEFNFDQQLVDECDIFLEEESETIPRFTM